MTKRTEKLLLSVFEYCVKAALKAQREGILAKESLFFLHFFRILLYYYCDRRNSECPLKIYEKSSLQKLRA